jgi:threonine/homoserine/homoserine lactone efflux protein
MRMTWSALTACVIAIALGDGARTVVDGGWYLLLGIFAGSARKLIARPRFRRIPERAAGTVLIALGVRMGKQICE